MNIWDESPLPPPEGEPHVPPAQGPAVPVGVGDDAAAAPEEDPHDDRALFQRVAGIPAWLLLALALAIWLGLAAVLVLPLGSGDDSRADEPAAERTLDVGSVAPPIATTTTSTTGPATAPSGTPSTVPPTTTVITAAPPTTSAAPSTTSAAPPTTSIAPSTTSSPTTIPPPTTSATTAAPTVAISEATTVVDDLGRTLTVTPHRTECRYGPECFVASFTIDGFDTQPQQFVCEFSSGERYVFQFSSAGANPACSTLDIPDSIVVEVAGLRSEPVTISSGD